MKRTNTLVISTPSKRTKTVDTRGAATTVRRDARFRGLKRGSRNVEEQKANDIGSAPYVADTTGTITLLNGIAEGTGLGQRVGRITNFTSVHVRGILQPVDTTTNGTLCRLLVVWDSDPNGAAPVMTDIFTASTSGSFNNLNNRDRFRVLLDETHAIGAVSSAATSSFAMSPTVVTIDRYVRLPKLQTVYQGTGATIASIQHGAMWMVTIGDQVANAGGVFSMATRVRYVDP